jgi:hypothetical protein
MVKAKPVILVAITETIWPNQTMLKPVIPLGAGKRVSFLAARLGLDLTVPINNLDQ